MFKKTVFLLSFVSLFSTLQAQLSKSDTLFKKPYYHYTGIQANLLFQQFINFNGNSNVNNNPYTFVYSKSKAATGGGFAMGTGLLVRSTSQNDGVSSVSVENINLSLRMGYEKKYFQQERWIPFWGVQADFGYLSTHVTSKSNQAFPGPGFSSLELRYFFGPSFRGGVLCAVSRHVLLGTEAYFTMQLSKTTSSSTGLPTVSSVNPVNMGFNVPTAIFLVFRY